MTLEQYKQLNHTERMTAIIFALNQLDSFAFVEIFQEKDVHVFNETGEDNAKWDVGIAVNGSTVRVENADLFEAIIDCSDKANRASDNWWKEQEAEKRNALAKLSTREKSLLGIKE